MARKGDRMALIRSWNVFAKHLVGAEEAWKVHQRLAVEMGRQEMEKLPVRAQKFVSVSFGNCNLRCKFNLLIPRLVDYARTIGGLKNLVIAPPTVEEIKEKARKRKLEQEKKKGDLNNGR